MNQNADMRIESGTCNVCFAPCSSCMHLNRALMGSKAEEFSDENCHLGDANQYSVDEGDVTSLRSRAGASLQHPVSENSNMLSVNSSHDSLSENAESRQTLLEGHDDNASCISRVSDANFMNNSYLKNADRINISCSYASVSRLGTDGSGSAPSGGMPGFSEIPSSKDADTGHSSPKVDCPCGQSQSGKCLSSSPGLMHLVRDSCFHIPEKLLECSIENFDSSLTKEKALGVVSDEKSIADKDSFINSTAKGLLKICAKSEANTGNDVGDAPNDDRKCSVHDGQHEKAEEMVKSFSMPEPQSENESDESDVVEHDVKVCDICGDAGREDLLAICSRCSDGAEHTYCMREMLQKVPEGDWSCEECKYTVETENQRLGKSEVCSTSQISSKRLSANIEVAEAPAAKRQALESSTGSPKSSSPKRLVALSRESSFNSLDKGKVKPGHQMPICNHSGGDDTHITHSTGHRGQIPKSTLLKSSSFNNLNSKPRVKVVDEAVPPKQKGGGEHTSKSVETPARMISKSVLSKSLSLGRSSATESKVKMLSPKATTAHELKGSRRLKESGSFDRKFLSRIDRPVGSTMAGSVVSTPKSDQKLTPRGETAKLLAANNNRELKVNQDGKSSTLSKSTSNISHKSPEPQVSSETTSTSVDEALQDVLPRLCEKSSEVEKTKGSSSDRVRPGVNTASKGLFCPKCKEFGHPPECCTINITQESGAEVSVTASSSSKEEMHNGNKLKAAIQAALLKRPEIYKKKDVPSQTDDFSASGTDLNGEVTSQDPMLVSNTPQNIISAEETHEQHEMLQCSTSETSKCSSANELMQHNLCPTDVCSQLGKSDSISLTAGKPSVRDLPNKALAMSGVLSKTSAIPEYEYIWQGVFEVHRNGKAPDLCSGIQAHLSTCASPKVLEVVNKFLPKVPLNEVSRLSTWPSQFCQGGAREDNIALYFFAKDIESYERHYKGLLDNMIRNDLALKGIFDGVELLIFPSNRLPENSQRWNMLFFLWGVFRGRRINHSGSAKKICIPSLNVMPIEKDFPSAVVTLSEMHCSPKHMDEESPCDKASGAIFPSTSLDQGQTMVSRNVDIKGNLEKQDSGIDTKSTSSPMRSTQLFQEMKSTGLSLKGNVLEHGQYKESRPPEAMQTSVSRRIAETKTDSDISDKQENALSSGMASVGDQERGAASNISKDKISERMNSDEDPRRPKRKQDDCCIDLEATVQEDLAVEGVDCQLSNAKKVQYVDLSDTVMHDSSVGCQKMPWTEVNDKFEDGESSSKKPKTSFSEIYGCCSTGARDPFNDSFASLANDFGSCSSVDDKRCEEACDEKIICEDSGTMERTFFPFGSHNSQLVLNGMSLKGPHEYEDPFLDRIPNLELALGGETKPPPKGMLPFFLGPVAKKNDLEKPPDSLADEQEDDGVAASLSLSLSFPSSNKEEHMKPVPKPELLPDGHRGNASLLLFGRFTDK